jgi:hypothetical protein
MMYLLIGLVIAIVIGVKLTRGNQRPTAAQLKPLTETELLRKLTIRAGGDQAKVGRLIAYEQKRQPDAARRALIVAALERWERDTR